MKREKGKIKMFILFKQTLSVETAFHIWPVGEWHALYYFYLG